MAQSIDPLIQSKHNQLDSLIARSRQLGDSSARDDIVARVYQTTRAICEDVVHYQDEERLFRTEKLDRVLTSPIWGYPIMLAMLGVIFWLTIAGANAPSEMLAQLFSWLEGYLTLAFRAVHAPDWLHGLLVLGLYRGISGWSA